MLKGNPIHLLLIEDEVFDEQRIRNTIKPFSDRIRIRDSVTRGKDAIALLQKNPNAYDVTIMDFQIADNLRGETLIKKIRELDPAMQIIVLTKMTSNITDFDFASSLIDAGAMWYCTKYPNDIEEYIYQPTDFILSIVNAYEKRVLTHEREKSNQKLDDNVDSILQQKAIIGQSDKMVELREQISQYAKSDTTVLIRGSSGTGKELAASNIHYQSDRRLEKFVTINCGSLPRDLVESELFGYERGAFTGARDEKPGLFEVADKGTIFLDEVAELPIETQVKLLRVIQEGELDKIGRTERVKVNVRLIAATNKDLELEVREGRFREDLYFRINVVSIWMHSLKDLPEEFPVLLDHFLAKFSLDMGVKPPTITPEALEALQKHTWQGNVRELQNVVQRLLLLQSNKIKPAHVQAAFGHSLSIASSSGSRSTDWDPKNIVPLKEIEQEFRRDYFEFVRQHTSTDADAARKLGLAPPNYHRMCKELGLK